MGNSWLAELKLKSVSSMDYLVPNADLLGQRPVWLGPLFEGAQLPTFLKRMRNSRDV